MTSVYDFNILCGSELFPPANEVAGRYNVFTGVSLSVHGGPHVIITHDALDLTVQKPLHGHQPN